MKKFLTFTAIAAIGLIAVSFTGVESTPKKPKYDTYTIDSASSIIKWVGKKFTGSHEGTIALKSGEFYLSEGKLKGGNFTADMASISVTDLNGKGKVNLERHLKNEDFFDTDNHSTANFVITRIGENEDGTWKIIGNMSIKDSTQSITFTSNVKLDGDKFTANADKVTIDRTKFGIKYKSKTISADLGDKFIYDNFDLNIKLVATKQKDQ
jgi:polyisoprenoid-binding protein YceI